MTRWFAWWFLIAWLATSGCTMFKVEPPPFDPVSLNTPTPGVHADFLIETMDHLDYEKAIGKVSDHFWGGQHNIKLTDRLDNYFETQVVRALRASGRSCYRYPGPFEAGRVQFEPPLPLFLQLELQDLTLSRHPESRWFSDQVIGVCKLRAVLFDPTMLILYQRQFVGHVNTLRPTDELVLEGIGLISRVGLSRMLSRLLANTVDEFRREGVPQILQVHQEYLESVKRAEHADPETGTPPSQPKQPNASEAPVPSGKLIQPTTPPEQWKRKDATTF